MKAVVAAFNQEKALVGAFSVIVQPVVEPMDRFAALIREDCGLADTFTEEDVEHVSGVIDVNSIRLLTNGEL